jgi:hypothetical protein
MNPCLCGAATFLCGSGGKMDLTPALMMAVSLNRYTVILKIVAGAQVKASIYKFEFLFYKIEILTVFWTGQIKNCYL